MSLCLMANKIQDTALLKIKDLDQSKVVPSPKCIIDKFSASVSTGSKPDLSALYYITNAMVAAEFREINNDEFKNTFLSPLDKAIRGSRFIKRYLPNAYEYPRADSNKEIWVQWYFNGNIVTSFELILNSILNEQSRTSTTVLTLIKEDTLTDPVYGVIYTSIFKDYCRRFNYKLKSNLLEVTSSNRLHDRTANDGRSSEGVNSSGRLWNTIFYALQSRIY